MEYLRVTTDIAKHDSGFNAAQVTVTAVDTTIKGIDVGSVKAGDKILLIGRVYGTKGGVAGAFYIEPKKVAGTAGVTWIGAGTAGKLLYFPTLAAAGVYGFNVAVWVDVNTAGSLTIGFLANSAGSDFTVPAENGVVQATVFSGSVV